jgi:uncharacterized membrane protein YedE/YeeE
MNDPILKFIKEPWPWYVAGPIVGICVPLLLLAGNKSLGVSSSLRHICAAVAPAKVTHLKYNWKIHKHNLFFVLGLVVSGFIGNYFLSDHQPEIITTSAQHTLNDYGIYDRSGFMPAAVFSFTSLQTISGFIIIIIGGFLIGFGTGWARGCTSGHGIFGLSTFQGTSLFATITFFAMGIFASWFLLPIILRL